MQQLCLKSTVRNYKTMKFSMKILLKHTQFSILRRTPRAKFFIATLSAEPAEFF